MLPRRQGRVRAGFTLVELLMVITIIGLLVGMGSYAAFQAIGRATTTAIGLDLQSLSAAIQSYKSDHQQYPPDFSDINYSNRQTRFNNHRSIAFPRCTIAYSSLKSAITNNSGKAYGYNYRASGGTITPLNLDTLDQAEALVFWLGGFPSPYTSAGIPMSSSKLFGFATDVTNPFRMDSNFGTTANANTLSQYRTTPLFDFDQGRLVDNDQDGWWEYIPRGTGQGSNGLTPPYVYFDFGGYTQGFAGKSATPPFTGYPASRPSDPNTTQASQLLTAFGMAVPYALNVTNSNGTFVQWQNPTSFQIVSAGGDGMYGNPSNTNPRIPCFPSGATYSVPGMTQGFFDQQELDNITNFTNGTIDDSSASQQGTAPAKQ